MGGGRSALCALWLCALPLIRGAGVPLPGGEPECSPDEYKPEGLSWCCKRCPAGCHVSADCGVNRGVPKCSPCEPGSFLSHPNGETSCWPCTQCRADQEMVAACTRTRDGQCQCASGSFFCDSPSCVENCFRCRRCPGAVLRPCNVTHDTVCDPEAGTEAPAGQVAAFREAQLGPEAVRRAAAESRGKELPEDVFIRGLVAFFIVLGIFLIVLVSFVMYRYKKKGVWPHHWFFSSWKGRLDGPDSAMGHQQSESLLPLNPETDGPAPATETFSSCRTLEEGGSAVKPEAGPHTGPSKEPAEGAELAQVAFGGSPAAPEQALLTAAPAAPGPQDRPKAAPSLRTLEQEYETKYFVTDTSNEDSIYYEFENRISDKHWKTFMRFIGLQDHDIDICECQNPGNLMEQHHQMLLRWRIQLGREASVFKLFAALHKMQLHMYLENIINGLVAEGILVRRSETAD
ncbi:tumor necrosis factor receptor superfamily member 1A-like isoform X2 [Neomonachus schauinslandi]|uniref:Tumor necrosis factor receptor superfamily member 1A-like isoform X2 n=1 Tax=Neomonachus schauinslandi TaxID=29088 RepID=A0A2Y9GNM9_NEOSC|nr:tumor necrosis factor receptor superfamily member 1A-like isoform X2 [Neomonachus schauinslandi]